MPIKPLSETSILKKTGRVIADKLYKESSKTDYRKYIKIAKDLNKDTFEYLKSIESALGNYAKHNNLMVVFKKADDVPVNVKLEVFKREGRFWEAIYNMLDMVHNPPVKLHKKNLVLRLNTSDSEKYVATTRKIYDTVHNVFKKAPKNIKDIFQ